VFGSQVRGLHCLYVVCLSAVLVAHYVVLPVVTSFGSCSHLIHGSRSNSLGGIIISVVVLMFFICSCFLGYCCSGGNMGLYAILIFVSFILLLYLRIVSCLFLIVGSISEVHRYTLASARGLSNWSIVCCRLVVFHVVFASVMF
jgi:hypothetical protein